MSNKKITFLSPLQVAVVVLEPCPGDEHSGVLRGPEEGCAGRGAFFPVGREKETL